MSPLNISYLATHPVALLVACVVVMMIVRMVAGMVWKIILVFAIVGAVGLAGGAAKLPAGISMESLASGLTGSVEAATATGKAVFGAPEPSVPGPKPRQHLAAPPAPTTP